MKRNCFRRQRHAFLKLPKLEEYRDGAIMYHVEGVRADIPVVCRLSGKRIVYPGAFQRQCDGTGSVKEYRKCYKKYMRIKKRNGAEVYR